MRIGYPCINRTISCWGNKTFRLKSYSEARLKDTVKNNLACLLQILKFNLEHRLLFLRLTSDLVPFASHPINTFDWKKHFQPEFASIGEFIRTEGMRISMHPDQFTLINSIRKDVLGRSIEELKYHVEILDLMNLDADAKVQIHVGGAYADKESSIERFVRRFDGLDNSIRRRLVIENDDKLYDLGDCLRISERTGVPILFDVFHHRLNGAAEMTDEDCLKYTTETWDSKNDGPPMVDYSSQNPVGVPGQHAETIDLDDFAMFLKHTGRFDFDVMLEIKDKEESAIEAFKLVSNDGRVRLNGF